MKMLFVAPSLLLCLAFRMAFGAAHGHPQAAASDYPQYINGKLLRPEGYREWVYLSSGLGMSYSASANDNPLFTNVFVPQWAYRQFLTSGKWPEKTMFVLEERASETQGSINKGGRFQTDLAGLAVEVKDQAEFPDKWAYFSFAADAQEATAKPKESCWECHDSNAAVEHSFAQFYPTLKPLAEKFGTYRKDADSIATATEH